jgi:hypothetical protein
VTLRYRLARRLLGAPFVVLPSDKGAAVVMWEGRMTALVVADTLTMTQETAPIRHLEPTEASAWPLPLAPKRKGRFEGTF